MYLKASTVDEATFIIANQEPFGGDMPIALPDGTHIKGTIIENDIASFSKLPTIVSADTIPLKALIMPMELLLTAGEPFQTHVGVSPNVTSRLWTRLKPGR